MQEQPGTGLSVGSIECVCLHLHYKHYDALNTFRGTLISIF